MKRQIRWRPMITAVLAIAVTLVLLFQIGRLTGVPLASAASAAEVAVGKPAPDVQGKDADGKSISMNDYKGKIIVLDYWASW